MEVIKLEKDLEKSNESLSDSEKLVLNLTDKIACLEN